MAKQTPKFVSSIKAAYNDVHTELSNALKSGKYYPEMRKLKKTFFALQGMAKAHGIETKALPKRHREGNKDIFNPAVSNIPKPTKADEPNNDVFSANVKLDKSTKKEPPVKPNNHIFETPVTPKVPKRKKPMPKPNVDEAVLASNANDNPRDDIKAHQDEQLKQAQQEDADKQNAPKQ